MRELQNNMLNNMLKSVAKNIKNLGISMRLHLPMPIVLLFLPCVCGIMFGRIESVGLMVVVRELVVFALGTIIMRSAGCLINEIVDRKIDKLVRRTENRPIASGELSVAVALIAALFLCLLGLVLGVTMLSPFTMKILFVGGLIMFVYPFTKRFMDYPQVVLGLCWNIGVLGGFASITNYVSLSVILLYIALIYWVSIFDTVYGYQDAKYDIKIGVRSMAVLYGENGKVKLRKFAHMMGGCLMFVPFVDMFVDHNPSSGLYYIFAIAAYIMELDIIRKVDLKSPESCRQSFYMNSVVGLLIAIACLMIRVRL